MERSYRASHPCFSRGLHGGPLSSGICHPPTPMQLSTPPASSDPPALRHTRTPISHRKRAASPPLPHPHNSQGYLLPSSLHHPQRWGGGDRSCKPRSAPIPFPLSSQGHRSSIDLCLSPSFPPAGRHLGSAILKPSGKSLH